MAVRAYVEQIMSQWKVDVERVWSLGWHRLYKECTLCLCFFPMDVLCYLDTVSLAGPHSFL